MDDKTQDSKKTVVAFVAGLLIGGLLVWLFSGSPQTTQTKKAADTTKKETSATTEVNSPEEETSKTSGTEASVTPQTKTVQGDTSFTVANQPAGTTVLLGETVKYPEDAGWIVVHADADGKPGNALGAARYETAVGLNPTTVSLLRATEAGKTYRVVYYTKGNDRMFDLKVDTPMTTPEGGLVEATFVAQ